LQAVGQLLQQLLQQLRKKILVLHLMAQQQQQGKQLQVASGFQGKRIQYSRSSWDSRLYNSSSSCCQSWHASRLCSRS
jgi:hypothetical protein